VAVQVVSVLLQLTVLILCFQQLLQLVVVVAELAVAQDQMVVLVVAQVVTRLVLAQEQPHRVLRVGTVTPMDIQDQVVQVVVVVHLPLVLLELRQEMVVLAHQTTSLVHQ
jgi:hypothetical protein